jgi:sulfofructose kinase
MMGVRPASFDFDVVGLGLNAVDYICVIPRFPEYDEKLKMQDFRRTVGGQVASALVACSRWGLKTKYLGKVGGDEMGDFSLSSLEEEGLDVRDVIRVENAMNQFAFILVDARTGERTIIWRRDERLAMKPEEVPDGEVRRGRFLLLDGHDAPAAARAAALAREAGVSVIIDAETVKPATREMIGSADYAVCSSGFPRAYTGNPDMREALSEIRDHGPGCVAVTLGREGAVCVSEDGYVESRGFRVKCVDSTGAGDVFHGAFILGLARGWDLGRILDFSNAAAALNCTSIGARGGIKPVEEIFDLIKTGSRW